MSMINEIIGSETKYVPALGVWAVFHAMSDGSVWTRTDSVRSGWRQVCPPLPDAAWVPGHTEPTP